MKRFKFKLEVVLQERKRKEDRLLQDWMLARRLTDTMIGARIALEKRLNEVVEDGTKLAGLTNSVAAEFYTLEAFLSGQKKRIEWKKQEIERAEKLTERKRLEMVLATQKRKAIEKLKSSKESIYRDEARKRELRQLDDIYVMRRLTRDE